MIRFREEDVLAVKTSMHFDAQWYSAQYADVAKSGMDPAEHFLWLGARLRRDPSPRFKTRFYLEQYPDVAAGGLNPLLHYISFGQAEGRDPLPIDASREGKTTTRRAQHRIDRTSPIDPADDWLLFVAYSPDGRLTECQKYQLGSFRSAGYRVALIVNSDVFANLVDPGPVDCDIQIVRENIGYDFGAWRHAVELLGGLPRARSVTFTNDSILPVKDADLSQLRQRVAKASTPVVFLTENVEVKPHPQSYFFALGRDALAGGALSIISDIAYYCDKDSLIYGVELHLGQSFSEAGHDVSTLYPTARMEANPTIHHWEQLLDRGFPFVKIQLVTAGILPVDDRRLLARIGAEGGRRLADHCERRAGSALSLGSSRNRPHVAAMKDVGRFNSYGAQQALNLPAEQNATLFVPLDGIGSGEFIIPKILAVVHGFYPQIASEILQDLEILGIPMQILVTTDQDEKAEKIRADVARLGLTGEVVVCPNRGRDVAPFLIEGRRFSGDAEVILHLHTKKSPHDSIYADWGNFLRRNLVGSRDIVLSILKVLQGTDAGLVYSDHFPEVVGLRNWGYNFNHAHSLMERLGIRLDADTPLEFPTSTMFWARREALDPLFKAGLKYDDFEEELGQVDGTLAHAIERSLVYVAELAGSSFTKVTALDTPSEADAPLLRLSARDLAYALNRPKPFLSSGSAVRSDFAAAVPEVYPVTVARSRSKRRRVTALLPTMKPEKIYGGITTALHVIDKLVAALPADVDLRVLITSDGVDAASVAELSRRLGRNFVWALPDDDVEGDSIVGVAEEQHIPISLRAAELYVATAWWTADLGYRLLDRQREMHGVSARLAYIIQDYEPGFYNWSNTFALAEATYHRPDNTVAIINSEELTNYVLARHKFAQAACVPFALNPTLAARIEPGVPEKLILIYGRPSVSRNCFELLCEGLRLWQSRDPTGSSEFELLFAGEDFSQDRIAGLVNASNVGKTSLDNYAAILDRTAVGISLMVSPHPSYPPLEMASAGCITITNAYEGKDLGRRADNIISLPNLRPDCLADCIAQALSRVSYTEKKQATKIRPLKSAAPIADFESIAKWLMSESPVETSRTD